MPVIGAVAGSVVEESAVLAVAEELSGKRVVFVGAWEMTVSISFGTSAGVMSSMRVKEGRRRT